MSAGDPDQKVYVYAVFSSLGKRGQEPEVPDLAWKLSEPLRLRVPSQSRTLLIKGAQTMKCKL